MKILHLADVHIRCLAYQKEYRQVFEELYDIIDEEKPDLVVIAGDVVHSKLTISPELVQMVSSLFSNIADRTKLLVTLGNHDLNLKAKSRQDAITPIVNALNHDNIIFKKYTEVFEIDGIEGVRFNNLSCVDPENWTHMTEHDKINVVLYHGVIGRAETELGFVLDPEDSVDTLHSHDYALLGDIHLRQQVSGMEFEYKEVDEAYLGEYLNQGWEIDYE